MTRLRSKLHLASLAAIALAACQVSAPGGELEAPDSGEAAGSRSDAPDCTFGDRCGVLGGETQTTSTAYYPVGIGLMSWLAMPDLRSPAPKTYALTPSGVASASSTAPATSSLTAAQELTGGDAPSTSAASLTYSTTTSTTTGITSTTPYYVSVFCPDGPTLSSCKQWSVCRQYYKDPPGDDRIDLGTCDQILADATHAAVAPVQPSGKGLVGGVEKLNMRMLPSRPLTISKRTGGNGSFTSMAAAGSLNVTSGGTYSPTPTISAVMGAWFGYKASQWDQNPGISSCEEWGYETFRDLFTVEKLVARTADPIALADALVPWQDKWLGNSYATTQTESFHPGTNGTTGAPVTVPKNAFAAKAWLILTLQRIGSSPSSCPESWAGLSPVVTIPSDVAGWLRAIAGMTKQTRPYDQRQRLMTLRNMGYSDQYLREAAGLQKRFLEVLAEREAYFRAQGWHYVYKQGYSDSGSYNYSCYERSPNARWPIDLVNLSLMYLDRKLFQMIRQAKSMGCLETYAGPCDIAPEDVAEVAREALVPVQKAREKEYQRCQMYTVRSSSPLPLGSLSTKCPYGDVVNDNAALSPLWWRLFINSFSMYLLEAEKYGKFLAEEANRVKGAPRIADPREGKEQYLTFGWEKSDSQGLSASLLSSNDTGAGYSYKGSYVVDGFDKPEGEEKPLCNAAVKASLDFVLGAKFAGVELASYRSKATFTGSKSKIEATAGSQEGSASWDTVLNGDFQQNVQDVYWSGNQTGSTAHTAAHYYTLFSTSQWIVVVFVPVKLTLGAHAEIGSSVREQSRLSFACNSSGGDYSSEDKGYWYPDMALDYQGGPMMRAYGRGSAEVDLGIASAGLYGEIDLVRLDFTQRVGTGFGKMWVTNDVGKYFIPAVKHDTDLSVGFSTLNGVLGVTVEVDALLYSDTFDYPVVRWSGLGASARVGGMDGTYGMYSAASAIYGANVCNDGISTQ